MYADGNPKTKKALKQMIADGIEVSAFQPGGIFAGATDGPAVIEGPHYPQPHRWYARVQLRDGVIIRVLG